MLMPAEISSHRAEPDFDDEDGAYLGCGRCEECNEPFREGDPKIIINDFIMDLECAKAVRDKISAEIAKYA